MKIAHFHAQYVFPEWCWIWVQVTLPDFAERAHALKGRVSSPEKRTVFLFPVGGGHLSTSC